MKKLLLITYMFPPIAGAGIQRTLKFIKYLPQYDVTPIVFCPENALWHVMDYGNMDLPYLKNTKIYQCGVKRLSKYYHLRFEKGLKRHPYFYLLALKYIWRMDYISSWFLECQDQALSVAIKEKIDCVLTSSPPHSVHFFGNYIKLKLKIPWIMDLRDSMFNAPERVNTKFSSRLESFLEGYHEKYFYRNADTIISVSQPILDSIITRFPSPSYKEKTCLITNAFDEDDYINITEQKNRNEKLIITYTGSFLGRRTPKHFLKALSFLCLANKINPKDIVVQFIGHFDEHIHKEIQNHATTYTIKTIDHQPYDKILIYQKNSDILLLVNSTEKSQGGDQNFTGKFFEYLGALKPIFALTPDGPLKETIEKGKFGHVAPPRDIETIAVQFENLYNAWKKKGHIPFAPDMDLRKKFTRKKTAKQLAAQVHANAGANPTKILLT